MTASSGSAKLLLSQSRPIDIMVIDEVILIQ